MKYVLIVLAIGAIWYFAQQFMNSGKARENTELGQAFLDKNAELEGVQTTASGLQYQVLEPGTGSEHPGATDKVRVHYHGTLIDGTVFDSSVDRGEPISFGLNQVIPGWTEGLQLMVEGEKTRLFIPSSLAYGNRSAGKIEPGSTLIFDVELLGINAD
ncbi:FKBP-type peptidyl-prolyl cis-trans isomerase [Granulosicoccus sp. 3-233]|uniref:FKBP-type peptidyl-prolyl cis-trans isomerase n=1 Tax=Granulosicoccus sp. 3-233 TaxID=3417969 RepID=UPI003D3432BF